MAFMMTLQKFRIYLKAIYYYNMLYHIWGTLGLYHILGTLGLLELLTWKPDIQHHQNSLQNLNRKNVEKDAQIIAQQLVQSDCTNVVPSYKNGQLSPSECANTNTNTMPSLVSSKLSYWISGEKQQPVDLIQVPVLLIIPLNKLLLWKLKFSLTTGCLSTWMLLLANIGGQLSLELW